MASTKSILKCSSGFVVYRLMLVLPALLSVLCGSVFLAHHLIGLERVQKNCIEQGFKIQWSLSWQIKKLIALNVKAQALRTERQAADVKLVAAMATQQPALITVAVNNLRKVIFKQMAFSAKQNAIKAMASVNLNAWRVSLASINGVTHLKSLAMAVRATPSESFTPSYFLQTNFSEKQKVMVQWNKYPHKGYCEVSLSQSLTPILLNTIGG